MKILKNILIVLVVLTLIGWAAMTLMNNKRKSEEETRIVAQVNDSIAVNVSQVSYQNINTDYVANGTFEPFQEMMFPSEVSGKVVRVMVDEGSYVRVGQTLAIIRGDAQSIDLSAAQAAYQNALTDNQRYENALQTGGVTQQQVDASRLQLKNAKAQLDQARLRVGDMNIKATISGIVNQRLIEPGSFVSPGTNMFEIVNVSSLKLRVEVDESQIVRFKVGDNIKVKASVYPDKEFVGRISFIAPKATASLNFPVEIQVSNSAGNELKAGMYGTAIFSTAQDEVKAKPVLVAPRAAFVGGVNNQEVFVVNPDATVELRKISAGRNFGEWIEILEGLKDGQTVVTSGQINLTDGAKVKVIQ
ncbi:MAG: efflux RND transporter periplasmic adaptor subunit [Flavobacteriaceae bacterium]|jgi:RND family efflux transporter MFP subunit|nr:efflux RND transporter periplasmic adaptor subunit [Flavobacteriaceae bacterium]